MRLHNIFDSKILKSQLLRETFQRKTISFYRYFILENPQEFRDQIYREWAALNCFGRIYVAREGINAQMSVPEQYFQQFLETLKKYPIFNQIPIKYAIEDNGKSFYKLTIKVRPKLVADGLDDNSFDVTNVGKHLNALEFHELVNSGEHIVVDMRNHYESEIGHFRGAICPEADTFREEISMVSEMLSHQKDRKVLLYCTGGIRCEKASAYLKHHGFTDVNQLHGGILEYAWQIKTLNIESNFIGKNFVFDERLGESVNGEVISHCHQCGQLCDTHVNCANDACHLLFIQCRECATQYEDCCSDDCKTIKNSSKEESLVFRNQHSRKFGNGRVYRKSFLLAKKLNFAVSEIHSG
ncbi:MAG: rhodanese-related sulfurtransferase [Prolixibacteraceae bacterium]|nr:rhodanese-related sulfurtransferase [Prolixibacteraceae bacterium]